MALPRPATAELRRRRLALAILVPAAVGAAIAVVSSGGGSRPGPALPPLPTARAAAPASAGDPFAYVPAHQGDFVARATAGEAHVLYAKSPDGIAATAARVANWRSLIQRVSAGTDVDPDVLEAIVFLESAGYPNAIAGPDPSAAAGLTQIVASTGQALLGMHIELAPSAELTRQILTAGANGNPRRVASLEAERARIDDRFDPAKSLAATIRYLDQARTRFGRLDLAVESYHMGIGNLAGVLTAYDGGVPVPYVQLYFDTAPDHHSAAYRLLSSFGDDSWTYYWRVLAAEQIMRLYHSDPAQLARQASLQTSSGSAAELLHPPDQTPGFGDASALDRAYAAHQLVPLPANPGQLGLRYARAMGALASGRAPLTVTSAVADRRYQQLEGANDPPAAAGWSFTLSRRYASGRQAEALQAVLDRLQALDLIAWERYPDEIEVTVAADAGQVLAHGA
jgi:hypothetical protein